MIKLSLILVISKILIMSRNNISKNDIVHNIKNRYRLPISYIDEFMIIFFDIKNGLKKDGRFKISKVWDI